MNLEPLIRLARSEDADAIRAILEPIIHAGEVFALPQDMSREEALAHGLSPNHEVFVDEDTGMVLGTYYLRPNQPGGGSLRLCDCHGGHRQGSRKNHVRPLTGPCEKPGLSGHAVQFRREH